MLERELQEIGLNEKEAKVYLATLELGQSVVQDIAKKAGVNRATTYFVIEALMKSGLMSSFHKGKKQFFIAADPDRLVEVLEQEKDLVEKREKNLKKLLPQLQSINNKQKDRPVVKYYEGKEGIKTMVDEVLRADDNIINFAYSVDALEGLFSEEDKLRWRKIRVKKNIFAVRRQDRPRIFLPTQGLEVLALYDKTCPRGLQSSAKKSVIFVSGRKKKAPGESRPSLLHPIPLRDTKDLFRKQKSAKEQSL